MLKYYNFKKYMIKIKLPIIFKNLHISEKQLEIFLVVLKTVRSKKKLFLNRNTYLHIMRKRMQRIFINQRYQTHHNRNRTIPPNHIWLPCKPTKKKP